MAEKSGNFQKVKSVGDSWIIARSKKYSDRIYYFNTETGQAVWNLSEADLIKAKEIDCVSAEKIPEPKDPPSDSREKSENYCDNSRVRPRDYNKQIINNGYSRPCIFSPFIPLFPAQDIAMPMQYNQNVWAVPPQQQLYMPNAFPSPFINPFGNVNPFPNSCTSNNYNMPQEQAMISNANTTQPAQEIDVRALHRTGGTNLSDKFKNLDSSRTNDETVEPNLPRVSIQNGVQDLRQLLIAKRSRNNSVCSESIGELSCNEIKNSYKQEETPEDIEDQLELRQILIAEQSGKNSVCSDSLEHQTSHGNKNSFEQENTTGDIEDQLEDLHVKSPEQDSLGNSLSSLDNEEYKWLSENVQLLGTKAVIDVEPLKHILGSPEDIWYLIPDTTVLLSNFSFINVLMKSDEQCRVVIPRGIYEALQVKARGGHKGPMGLRARSACRFIAQLVKTEQAFIDHQEESTSHDVDSFENSCSRLVEMKVQFIALSNDTEKLEKIKEKYPVAFTVEEVKECITLHRTQIENNISDLPMTITIPNNTSDDSTAAKKEKTKIVYRSPKKNSNDTSNKTVENDKDTTVYELRHELLPTISHSKVDSEIQVSLTSPKKMVNAEVQTELYLIENSPVFKSPKKFAPQKTLTTVKSAQTIKSSNQKTAESITHTSNEISSLKKRELKLRRNPVAQSRCDNPNTPISSQLKKKSKWWRRKKMDAAKPVASEPVMRDSIQIQAPKPGIDTPDGVVVSPKPNISPNINSTSKTNLEPIQTRSKTARSQQKKTLDNNLEKSTETACAKIDTGIPVVASQKGVLNPIQTIDNIVNLQQETRPKSNPIIFTRKNKTKTNSTKPIIAPPKLAVNSIQTKQQSAITEQIVNNDRTETKLASNRLNSPTTDMQPLDKVIHEKHGIKLTPQTNYTQTSLIRTTKTNTTKPIIAPPKLAVNSIQTKQQSAITEQIVNNDRTEKKLASNRLNSPKADMQPLDKEVIHEKHGIKLTPQTNYTQTSLIRTIFSPRRDAYKSPESYTDVQSPKKMKDMSPEIGMQKMIEESISSSDIVSNTRSSVCSEKSIILKPTPSNQRKDSSSCKQMFELTDEAMEETLRNGSEEWVSRFVQIMEEVLSQVLQLDPSSEHEISPPWTIIESTECIKNKFKSNIGVRTTATEFLAVVFKILDNDRGDIRRDLTPSNFLEIFSYAVNFVLKLQQMLPMCEDISIGLESLYQLLNDIKNYNNEPIEFTDNDPFEESYNVTNLEENYDNNVRNGEKLPETISTPTRQTNEVDAILPQVKFVRKFNSSDSFEKFMQQRNQTLTQLPEIHNHPINNQSQMKLLDSPNNKVIPNDSTKNLNESTSFTNYTLDSELAQDTFDFERKEKRKAKEKAKKRRQKFRKSQKIQQKIDYPSCIAQIERPFTNSPLQHFQNKPHELLNECTKVFTPQCPGCEDKLKGNPFDMDVLDYSEDREKLDYVDDNLNFVSKDNDFNDSVDLAEYNTNNVDYTTNDLDYPVNKYNNEDFFKINSNRNLNDTSEAMAIDSNAKAIVNKFLKEMKQTFLHVNSFCEQASKELREISKLTTIRQMELQEQAEEAKFHINNLLNTLDGISNRERHGSESSLEAIFRSCKGIRLTYRDIIEKCSTQARILLVALTSICDMLELAM